MELFIAEPHGMCSGVARALKIATKTLNDHPGDPLWCFHEIVHNEHVVAALRERGARFVDSLEAIPQGARVLFSAHGVSPEIRREAERRHLKVVDATCPFVAKVHQEACSFTAQSLPIALIGHKGHDEVVGILGEAPENIHVVETAEDVKALAATSPHGITIAVLSQTTISREMFDARVSELNNAGFTLIFPDHRDICYATQERQLAVRELAQTVDHILVLGSRNSSNSKRLAEVAETAGCTATLIASPEEVTTLNLTGIQRLGITSGASTPEELFNQLKSLVTANLMPL